MSISVTAGVTNVNVMNVTVNHRVIADLRFKA
jgi:hypothetical protein